VPFFDRIMLSFSYLKAGTSLCLVLTYLRSFKVNTREFMLKKPIFPENWVLDFGPQLCLLDNRTLQK